MVDYQRRAYEYHHHSYHAHDHDYAHCRHTATATRHRHEHESPHQRIPPHPLSCCCPPSMPLAGPPCRNPMETAMPTRDPKRDPPMRPPPRQALPTAGLKVFGILLMAHLIVGYCVATTGAGGASTNHSATNANSEATSSILEGLSLAIGVSSSALMSRVASLPANGTSSGDSMATLASGQNIFNILNRDTLLKGPSSGATASSSSNYTVKIADPIVAGFQYLNPAQTGGFKRQSSCQSCQMLEKLKQDNLEVIKMHILARLQMSQLPNITAPRSVPQNILENFYRNYNTPKGPRAPPASRYSKDANQNGKPGEGPYLRQAAADGGGKTKAYSSMRMPQQPIQVNEEYISDGEAMGGGAGGGGESPTRPDDDDGMQNDEPPHTYGNDQFATNSQRSYDKFSYNNNNNRNNNNKNNRVHRHAVHEGDRSYREEEEEEDYSDRDANDDDFDDMNGPQMGGAGDGDFDHDGDSFEHFDEDYYDDDEVFSRTNSYYVFPTTSRVRHYRKTDVLNFKFDNSHSKILRCILHIYVRGRSWIRENEPGLLESPQPRNSPEAGGGTKNRGGAGGAGAANGGGGGGHHHHHAKEIVLSVHRAIRRPNALNFTHTVKLAEAVVKLPAGYGQWKKIEVKDMAEHWMEHRNASQCILIKVSQTWMRSLIVTGGGGQQNPLSAHIELVTEEKRRLKRSTSLDCQESDQEVRCCRYPLKVNFTNFGWHFVVAPTSFDAYFCNGECKVGYLEQYAHTHITSLTTSATPCCSPTKMSPLSLLYFNLDQILVLSTIPNMSVEKCSCS